MVKAGLMKQRFEHSGRFIRIPLPSRLKWRLALLITPCMPAYNSQSMEFHSATAELIPGGLAAALMVKLLPLCQAEALTMQHQGAAVDG
jgi:hypothetical protein